MGSMVQHFVMISDSMEKHGEHGTAFSHDFRQHGKAWESMGSMVTPHFHDFEEHGEAWYSIEKMPFIKINTAVYSKYISVKLYFLTLKIHL